MKKKKIKLFIFIDAFGWEILQEHPQFLEGILVDQKKMRTILGYSSACDPSIISGCKPCEHKQWSAFYYSPVTCPYKWVKWLRFLPKKITDYHRVRHYLSKLIKKIHGFTGYFQIYNVPFEYLPLFDYAEKKRIWAKNGLVAGKTIFDYLIENNIPYYVGDQESSDQQQLDKVNGLLRNQLIEFAYLLLGQLDGLMHASGTHHEKVDQLINWYDQEIRKLIKTAYENYEEVEVYIFTDHGMHNVIEAYDLQTVISNQKLTYGTDYVAIYDSTMARFWFLNVEARKKILECLNHIEKGRILSEEELKGLGVYFPDHQYGETIFLMNPGILIIPSFMGQKKIPGMHGYHPDEPDSYAMLCSNRILPENINSIEQIFELMKPKDQN